MIIVKILKKKFKTEYHDWTWVIYHKIVTYYKHTKIY